MIATNKLKLKNNAVYNNNKIIKYLGFSLCETCALKRTLAERNKGKPELIYIGNAVSVKISKGFCRN